MVKPMKFYKEKTILLVSRQC